MATSHVVLPRSLRTTLNTGQNITTSGHRVWEWERGSKNENCHQLLCAMHVRQSKADMATSQRDVRFSPNNGRFPAANKLLLCVGRENKHTG
jgi:hypothetical protein